MAWYYAENGQQKGPVSEVEFNVLVSNGTIQPDTLVWNETMTDWVKYASLQGGGITEKVAGAPFKKCVECGKTFSHADMINYENSWVCASCKPIFVQKLKEGMSVSGILNYAGFWIRFGAVVIDGILLWIVNMVISIPLFILVGFMAASSASSGNADEMASSGLILGIQAITTILQIVIAVGYETWFIGRYGATPGKMACKIKVVTSDNGRVSYLRAFGRYFAKMVSGIILCIGYLMAAFDGEKRALHDHMCNTRVVYK